MMANKPRAALEILAFTFYIFNIDVYRVIANNYKLTCVKQIPPEVYYSQKVCKYDHLCKEEQFGAKVKM